MVDLTTPAEQLNNLADSLVPRLEGKKVILLFNKVDLVSQDLIESMSNFLPQLEAERIFISAKNSQNIEKLQQLLVKTAAIPEIGEDDVIVTNLRHLEALNRAHESIQRVQEGLSAGITHDFLSQDIRECMFHLGEITGQITTDEILGNIFSKFCIGK